MNLPNNLFYCLLVLGLLSLLGCQEDSPSDEFVYVDKDTIPPTITLLGKSVDTTYLQITFADPEVIMVNGAPQWQHAESNEYFDLGVSILDEVEGSTRCPDEALVEVTGKVNNKVTGI